MLMVLRMGRPVAPFHAPDLISSANDANLSSVSCTSATTSTPSTTSVASREAEGRVEHRSVFRHVDACAFEHRFDPFCKAGLVGQLHQRREDLGVDQMLREVGSEANGVEGHPLGSVRVVREEIP